ncbi:MAG: hypothetical protein ACJ8J0_08195 [Longimicrobiaceae bacterium]
MAKAITLIDNFNASVFDTIKWTVLSTAQATNRRVEIRPAASLSGTNLGLVLSGTTFDLIDSEARVEVIRALGQATGAVTQLTAQIDANNSVSVAIRVGTLRAEQIVAGTSTVRNLVPYDPRKHRWLRLRHTGGTLYWEYSADGNRFDALASASPPITLTAVNLGFGAGTTAAVPAPGFAVFDNFNFLEGVGERRIDERRLSAAALRGIQAGIDAERDYEPHVNNNDETTLTTLPYAGNYSKSLKHDSIGDPDPYSYGTLLRALQSEDAADFDEIVLASSTAVKLTNPQSGLAYELGGADTQEVTQPPAPAFTGTITRHEAGELYWMAVARDVPFTDYGSDTKIANAVTSLNAEFSSFGGTLPVATTNIFRGVYPGEQVGPYISQFLLKGNVDPRRAVGILGRDAADGLINYGTQTIPQKLLVATSGAAANYLTVYTTWLDVQNGMDKRGLDSFDATPRFIHTLRDGATFVHFDFVLNAFYNAAQYLLAEPTGNQSTVIAGTGRPFVDMEFPFNVGNPYTGSAATPSLTQAGFGTFGPISVFDVLANVVGRAIRAVWYQKWGVHRRLRPEEYGGRVQNQINGSRTYFSNEGLINSLSVIGGRLHAYYGPGTMFPDSYLLPQAYPEGCPTHPAYGAGHATGAGACATILKAFFDENTQIKAPLQANNLGTGLITYSGSTLLVGGELNKLAGNIALFRNAAGVHWRSDYTESLPLGEAVAIRLLQELSLDFNETDGFFQFTTFANRVIRIHRSQVELLA